jgi:NDP-sugar pyrophosphorylase family protein
MNGDILTKLDFADFIRYHVKHNFDLTVMVKKFKMKFPYGILSIKNRRINKVTEKPIYQYDISTGIYLLNCKIIDFVPKNRFFTMPQLISFLIKRKRKIGGYFSEKQWTAVEEQRNIEEIYNSLDTWLHKDEL